MIHTYSLADHELTVGLPEKVARKLNLKDENGNLLTSIKIGGPGESGEGSFVGQIVVTRNENTWATEGDATGSWVHNKSLNKTGTIEVQITQISDVILDLYNLFSIYESIQESMPGLTLTVDSSANDNFGSEVRGNDCYLNKPADLTLASTAGQLSWVFTCGQIFYYQ